MTAISSGSVAQLREKTGAGIMDCKKALQETGGDFDRAVACLRKKGAAIASKKSSRVSREGIIHSYIHTGGRLGVLIELNCETDFVARTDEFRSLAGELSLQIAAANPLWVSREDVPTEDVRREREIFAAQCAKEKKPEKIIPRIVDGKIEKYYEQVCLLDQVHVRDTTGKTKIKSLVGTVVGKLGENIQIKRFMRYQLGGE